MYRVILEKVTKRSNVDERIVDGRDFNVGVVQRRSQDEPSDTPKAIDAELDPASRTK